MNTDEKVHHDENTHENKEDEVPRCLPTRLLHRLASEGVLLLAFLLQLAVVTQKIKHAFIQANLVAVEKRVREVICTF